MDWHKPTNSSNRKFDELCLRTIVSQVLNILTDLAAENNLESQGLTLDPDFAYKADWNKITQVLQNITESVRKTVAT